MNIHDIEVGQTVKLNKSPTYGEAPDYLHQGMQGTVIEVNHVLSAIAVDFKTCGMFVCPLDLDPILN